MTAFEALPQLASSVTKSNKHALEPVTCCKSSAEKDQEATSCPAFFFFFSFCLVHMVPKGSIIPYKLNSNGVNILTV